MYEIYLVDDKGAVLGGKGKDGRGNASHFAGWLGIEAARIMNVSLVVCLCFFCHSFF